MLHDVESLKRAFAGASGAFCVTFFWAHLSPERNMRKPRPWLRRPRQRVRHVIWSTLEDTRRWVPLSDNRMPTLMGNIRCRTSMRRGKRIRSLSSSGCPRRFSSRLFIGTISSHFGMGPKPGPDETLVFTLAMGRPGYRALPQRILSKVRAWHLQKRDAYLGKLWYRGRTSHRLTNGCRPEQGARTRGAVSRQCRRRSTGPLDFPERRCGQYVPV